MVVRSPMASSSRFPDRPWSALLARWAARRPYGIRSGGRKPMKMTIEVDCSPEEARRVLGLPDGSALNAPAGDEMKTRIDANRPMIWPDELMKNWMSFGAGAQEQF